MSNNVTQTWIEMGRRLAIAFPKWVIARLEARSDGKGFAVKAIPFVIVFLSLASITNLAGRAYVHHGDLSAYFTGAGIAVLVPIAVLAAMLIEGRWAYLFWFMAFIFAGISGTIQYNIYLLDDSWLSMAEAVAFGFGVPVSEVMLAIMEARLVLQIDERKAKETAEAMAKAETDHLAAEAKAKVEAADRARLQREAEDHEFERRKREAELRAYETKLAQDSELARERALADLRIREQKAAGKLRRPDANDDSNGDSDESKVIRFYASNPLAPQREAADSTGLNQSKVNRILKKLESDEVIHRNGNGVEILRYN